MAPPQESATRRDARVEPKFTTSPSLAETQYGVFVATLPLLAAAQYGQLDEEEVREVLERYNKMLSECDEMATTLAADPTHVIPRRVRSVREGLDRLIELFGDDKTETDNSEATPLHTHSEDAAEARLVPGPQRNVPHYWVKYEMFKEMIEEYEYYKMHATSTYVPKLADEAREFLEEKGEFWNESWGTLCRTEDGAHAIRCISVRAKDQEQYGSQYGMSWEFAFDPRLNGDFQQEWHSPHAEPGGRWRKVPDYSEYHEARRVLEETGEQIEFTLPIPFLEPEDPIEPAELESVHEGKKNLRALMLAGKHETLKRVLKTHVCKEKTKPEIYERYSKAVEELE